MRVSNLTLESLDAEDYVVITAIDSNGKLIESEIAGKLFQLNGNIGSGSRVTIPNNEKDRLDENESRQIAKITESNVQRNSIFFEEEMEKLSLWADDKRKGLKAELKEYDDQINVLKKEARLAASLPGKLAIQKKLRDLDKKRDTAWKEYDATAKVIEKQKDELLDRVEKKLKQSTNLQTLFTIRWSVV